MFKVIEEKTGREIKKGDEVIDFRGDKAIFDFAVREGGQGFSGKVCVIEDGEVYEYYDRVFGLIVTEE